MQVRTTQRVHSLTLLTIYLPLGHSRLALPVLALSPHQTLSSRPLSLFRGPSSNIPNVPVFLFPFSLRTSPLSLAHLLGPLTLVLLALTPALSGPVAPPFSRIHLSHSLSTRLPSRSSPALLPWSFSSPTLSPYPSPAWISLRCLAFAFVGHTLLVFTLPFALGLQISTKCMVIFETVYLTPYSRRIRLWLEWGFIHVFKVNMSYLVSYCEAFRWNITTVSGME